MSYLQDEEQLIVQREEAMTVRIANPQHREVLVYAHFVQNVQSVSQRIQSKRSQLRTLAETGQT